MNSLVKIALSVLLLFSVVLLTGCGVSEEEYYRLYAELAASQAKVDELEAAYSEAQAEVCDLQNQIGWMRVQYELVGDTPEITAQNIVRWYYRTHIYNESDSFVCRDMALDVWDMLKAHGIHALIQIGNAQRQVRNLGDCTHVWVQAEVLPGKYLALDPTIGCAIWEKDYPFYYYGWTFGNPREYKQSTAGGGRVQIPGEGTFDGYESGSSVLIEAVPDPGYKFVCWTGDTGNIDDIYAASTNVTVSGNFTIGATFSPIIMGITGGTVLQDLQYTWDANGNLLNRADLVVSETESFYYDHLDRLTGVSGPYEESYTYNTTGNIMSRNGIDYYYDDPDHAHAVTSVGTKAYAYDANGNMTYRDGQTLAWDIENRLISVSANATTIAQFFYDGDGNRVKKIENGETILYINKYYEVNLTTSNATSYYYHGNTLVAKSENSTLMYVHQDHLTSTSLMTDNNGVQIGTKVKYLPFGETRSGSVPTDKLFTGQRLDSTGLYYCVARYYDANIRRFISPDFLIQYSSGININTYPLTVNISHVVSGIHRFTRQAPINPQALNRYTYVLNNPLCYIDPNGENPIIVFVVIVIVITIVITDIAQNLYGDYPNPQDVAYMFVAPENFPTSDQTTMSMTGPPGDTPTISLLATYRCYRVTKKNLGRVK